MGSFITSTVESLKDEIALIKSDPSVEAQPEPNIKVFDYYNLHKEIASIKSILMGNHTKI